MYRISYSLSWVTVSFFKMVFKLSFMHFSVPLLPSKKIIFANSNGFFINTFSVILFSLFLFNRVSFCIKSQYFFFTFSSKISIPSLCYSFALFHLFSSFFFSVLIFLSFSCFREKILFGFGFVLSLLLSPYLSSYSLYIVSASFSSFCWVLPLCFLGISLTSSSNFSIVYCHNLLVTQSSSFVVQL